MPLHVEAHPEHMEALRGPDALHAGVRDTEWAAHEWISLASGTAAAGDRN